MQKESLLKEGFSSWNKRDFFKFINMCELYGRDNYEHFSELIMSSKTIEEIKDYSECFWKSYTKIDNYKKYIERIEKGEKEIAHRLSIDKAIDDKFARLFDIFLDQNPGKPLTEFTF
jgi:SWI/SNF-related matrix-associated actin-dependent regulator of chromatin subfamily A member 5